MEHQPDSCLGSPSTLPSSERILPHPLWCQKLLFRLLEKHCSFAPVELCRFDIGSNSVQPLIVSDILQPHGLQHVRLPCPSPTSGAYSNSRPSSWWCHPTISASVVPRFFSCPQSFPASGSFPMSQFFTSGGQTTRASASVLPMNTQDWLTLGMTNLIS